MRTARYRASMDARKAPTAQQCGLALAVALETTPGLADLTVDDMLLVKRALAYLRANGFDIAEPKKTMRRLRNKIVDPMDRGGEESENTGAPIRPSGWPEALF
jgi:hypothetical protein